MALGQEGRERIAYNITFVYLLRAPSHVPLKRESAAPVLAFGQEGREKVAYDITFVYLLRPLSHVLETIVNGKAA